MNLYDLIINDKEIISLDDIILGTDNQNIILGLIKEYKYINEFNRYGLSVNNKILLHGHSGCGKTTTAKAIANALGKNIMILNLSNIVCARIGETSQNMKMVFDKAAREKAILFLDEFDQVGKARAIDDKDVGEMRRLVNTMIQLIDYYPKNSILIGATNYPEIIDGALLRRFQLRINFEMPKREVIDVFYDKLLSRFPDNMQNIERKYNISFAEAKDYAHTIVKSLLIEEFEKHNNVSSNA